MRIKDMITKMNLLDILLTSPHYYTFVGNDKRQQVRFQILIFKQLYLRY